MLSFALTLALVSPVDPCALRHLVDKRAADIAPLVEKADGRARACLMVVHGQALAREGHGSDAARAYEKAMEALPEVETWLALAEKRALANPTAPARVEAPKSADEAAERVMALVREAKPRKAAEMALAFPRKGPPHEGLETATLTALVRAERFDEAVVRASKLPATDTFLKARAWTLGKAGKLAEARDLYEKLARTSTDAATRAEASFLAAFAAYEAGDLDDAKARFSAALPGAKGTAFDASARWYLALCDLLRGRDKDAVPVLDALVRELPTDKEALKHRYWLGRALLASDKKRAQAELLSVAQAEPLDFYGMLARARLGREAVAGRAVAADAVIQLARHDAQAQQARLLFGVGLDDEARTLARGLGEGLPEIGLQQAIDDATFGWRRGGKFIPLPREKNGVLVADARWRVSYAAPWPVAVEAAAKKAGISTSLLYAIMRTESGFDPRAVSVAGARGVLQLLPSAARGAAKLAGRPPSDAERIFEPEVAVDLGAALLGKNARELGSALLAAAAYNGAAPNVVEWMKRWTSEHKEGDVELFVERIPFKETRDYVKRVLAVEATYRALGGGKLALNLPAAIPTPPERYTHFPVDE